MYSKQVNSFSSPLMSHVTHTNTHTNPGVNPVIYPHSAHHDFYSSITRQHQQPALWYGGRDAYAERKGRDDTAIEADSNTVQPERERGDDRQWERQRGKEDEDKNERERKPKKKKKSV